jgi:hypothetical protein
MALFGKGGRARKGVLTAVVTAGTVGALQALTMVPAGAVAPGGCTYNPATQTVTIQQEPGDATILSVVDASALPGGASNEIQITLDTGTGGAQDCGSATTSNTTSVVMLGSGLNATDEFFAVNNNGTGGSFGSIAFSIDMGNNAAVPPAGGDAFAWFGTTGADTVTVTNTTFDANGGKGTLVGTEYMEFDLGAGADTLDAGGVTGVPLSVEGEVSCNATGVCAVGAAGNDKVTTGSGNDNPTAFPPGFTWNADGGGYYMDGAPSFDWIIMGSSRADGQDTFQDFAPGWTVVDYSARTATNYLINNGAATSGEGTCPGAAPGCEGDSIGAGIAEMVTGSGNDKIVAASAGTWMDGGAGNDTFDAANLANVTIDNSWSAPDVDITIDLQNNKQTGYGDDVIINKGATMHVTGGAGDDTFIYPTPSVYVFGSFCGFDGHDTVDASAQTGPRTINLNAAAPNGFDGQGNCGTSVPGSDDSTEDVLGGSDDDAITGNSLANHLTGNDGDDMVLGSPLAPVILDAGDFLEGNAGNDGLFGGLGADTASWKACECADGGVTVDISLGFAEGEGDDSILDYIEKIEGSKKSDNLKTGPTGAGSSVNSWIKGFGGGDSIVGSDGNDRLAGGGGNDKIRMGAGDDDGLGGGGNDKFWGGGGVDSADGGAGKNTCKGVEIRKNCKKMKNSRAVSFAAKLARLD